MVALGPLLAVALPVLLVACTVPIYSDEIVWKIMQARYFLDHGLVTNAFPQCGPSFLLPPPLTHLPARILDAALYQDLSHPLKLRVLGVLGAGALLALFYRTIRAVVRPVPRRTTTVALLLVFWGLGLMPFLSVMNRPELPILLGMAGLILGAILVREPEAPRWLQSGTTRLIVYLLVVVLLLGTHPKTLFFVPVMMVAGWFWLPARTHRALALAVLVVVCAQTADFASRRYDCPNDATTAGLLAEVALQLGDVRQQPGAVFLQAIANVRNVPQYFGHLVFKGQYMAGWLPEHPRLPVIDDVGDLLVYVAIALVFGGMALALGSALRRWARDRRLAPAPALLVALVPTLLALVTYQSHKNAYDGAFLLTLGGLGIVLGWPPNAAPRRRRPLRVILAFLTLTTLASEGRLLYHFGPWATHEWLAGGNLPGLVEGTISGFHYDRVNAEVLETARLCGIDVAERPKFVLVDDLTYPALSRTTYPLHTMGVSWWGVGISDQYEFLQAFGSEGVVVRCRSITIDLQDRARRRGDLCCLPSFVGARERRQSSAAGTS